MRGRLSMANRRAKQPARQLRVHRLRLRRRHLHCHRHRPMAHRAIRRLRQNLSAKARRARDRARDRCRRRFGSLSRMDWERSLLRAGSDDTCEHAVMRREAAGNGRTANGLALVCAFTAAASAAGLDRCASFSFRLASFFSSFSAYFLLYLSSLHARTLRGARSAGRFGAGERTS